MELTALLLMDKLSFALCLAISTTLKEEVVAVIPTTIVVASTTLARVSKRRELMTCLSQLMHSSFSISINKCTTCSKWPQEV